MSNWLKTLRFTVNCPFCGCGYVFKKEETFKKWIESGRKDALHRACKQVLKSVEKDRKNWAKWN